MKNITPSAIARISLYFISKYRISLLILLILTIFGFITYNSFLKREGFPPINVPIVVVQTPYFVNNAEKVEKDVTTPISKALSNIKEVKSVRTTSSAVYSAVVIEFEEGTVSTEEVKTIKEEIAQKANLPAGVEPSYLPIEASKIDGKYDLLFTVASDGDGKSLETKANELKAELEKSGMIAEAIVIPVIETQTDFNTGKQVEVQTSFNKVGIKKDGELIFKNAINIGAIKKSESTGTIEFSKEVHRIVDKMQSENKLKDYDVEFTFDQANALQSQISSLQSNAITAMLVVLIVLIFFINWRSAVVLALFLPLTLGAVFVTMYLAGESLNVISLFALVLVLGLFVDDGTIVVEAIDYYKKQGLKGKDAVVAALNSIGIADLTGTLTTMLVFVPLIFISGILGNFIRILPITVILALGISIIIALTIIPMLSNLFLRDEKEKAKNESTLKKVSDAVFYGFSKQIVALGSKVGELVNFYLKSKIATLIVLIATIALIAGGLSFAGKLKFNVFPPAKNSDGVYVNLLFPGNKDIKNSEALTAELEKSVANEFKDEVRYFSYFNADEKSAYALVRLTPMKDRRLTSVEIAKRITKFIEETQAVNGVAVKGKAVAESQGPTPSDYPFAMQVVSDNQKTLESSATIVSDYLKGLTVLDNIKVEDVVVENLDTISKIDGKRYIQIKAKLNDNENTGALVAIQDKLKENFTADKLKDMGLSEDGLGFDLGQESENLESFNSTIFAAIGALFVTYIVLVIKFNSFSQPLLVLIAIPMSFPLLFPGLLWTNNALSFFVMVGITGLVGIVANNTIMLIEYANKFREEGMGIRESISEAIKIRFRPIMTTSAVTVTSLLPLALTDPFWEGLALTIIFGLVSSVILVILAFPAYYSLFESVRAFKDKLLPGLKTQE